MPLLRRKPAKPAAPAPPPPPVEFDPTGGDVEVRAAVEAFAAGDWRPVHERFDGERDWDLRGLLVANLAPFDAADAWVKARPKSALARTVQGEIRIRVAWDIRGSGKADTVGQGAWKPFHAMLEKAEASLVRAAELLPEDPVPWTVRQRAAMGLGRSIDERLACFEQACARDADYLPAWNYAVQTTSQKWGGSHGLGFDLAQASLRRPDGSPARVAVVNAHEHRREYYAGWEDARDVAAQYFKRPEVVAEVAVAAAASVLSPAAETSAWTPLLRSWFAYGLAFIGDARPEARRDAATMFDLLGDDGVPEGPWRRWTTGGAEYARIRALCRRARDAA